MPQLMETCIRNNLHEEGLVLLRHANTLYSEHLYLHTHTLSQPAPHHPMPILPTAATASSSEFSMIWSPSASSKNPCCSASSKLTSPYRVVCRFCRFWSKTSIWFPLFHFSHGFSDSTRRPNTPMKPGKPGKPRKRRMSDRRGRTAGK